MDWGLVFWTLIFLISLWWLVRQIHEGLQELMFLLTGDKAIAIYLFQILLLPGVALHEFSHYLVARLLGVRVRKVSLRPRVQSGKIQMGAVAMDRPDFVRGVLIGMAPLIVGSTAVLLIGNHIFDVNKVVDAATSSGMNAILDGVQAAFTVNDAWIWLYFIFAISTAMMPSESDREALWPMAIFVAIIAALVMLAGWGPALLTSLTEPVTSALSLLVVAFGFTLLVDMIFAGIIWVLKVLVSTVTGRRLEKTTR